MKVKIILISIVIVFLSCQEQKVDYMKMGEEILSTNNLDKTELLKSIDYFKLELENNPNSVEALKNLAIAYGRVEEHDKSFAEINKAINQNNKFAEELFTIRGMQYFVKKNYEESILDFQKELSYNTTNQKNYKLIFTSKLWQKYNKDGEWDSFEKSDVQNLIDEVYAESSEKPTYEELVDLSKPRVD